MVNTTELWSRTKSGSKSGFDRIYNIVDKLGTPVNKLSNKLGSEAFWPTTLDKEGDKAARILKSFCKDGFYQEEERPNPDGPAQKQKVLKKIPAQVIREAKGLAIFTTMRTGLWVSGAGGSGILVGRKDDGSWSPPSGIMLHTAGLGFLAGIDIYDCVVVINTHEALDAFARVRCTLGGEVSAVAGPVGMGGMLESELHKRRAPIFTYLKSRGLYAGIQVDGTIVIERTDENERFYGQRLSVGDILAGKVRHPPFETRKLLETIKAAEGDNNVDESLIPDEPPPGDFEIENKNFGVPDEQDPDPFGVRALEEAGLEIREAGSHKPADIDQFEFKPSPTSPIFNTFRKSFDRSSIDGRTVSNRSSWRTSTFSSITEKSSGMVDMSTQTDFDAPPAIKVAPPLPPRGNVSPAMKGIPEGKSTDDITDKAVPEKSTDDTTVVKDLDTTKEPNKNTEEPQLAEKHTVPEEYPAPERHTASEEQEQNPRFSKSFDDIELDDEEPIIQEIQQAAAPQVINRARIVTVAKPIAPKLPQRSPFRGKPVNADLANGQGQELAPGLSPVPRTPSTPSLGNDGSTSSSQNSIASVEAPEHTSSHLHHISNEDGHKDETDAFHEASETPFKAPGGFY